MATFRVGQRVRCVRRGEVTGHAHVLASKLKIGFTGTVVGLGHKPATYLLEPDEFPGSRGLVNGWQLEPLQPERNQTIAWSECAWQPPHMREVA